MHPVDLFKSLSDDTRLKSLLLIRQNSELCVCDLQNALGLSQPKISRHLAELRRIGLVTDERRGKWVYYHINPALPVWVSEIIDLIRTNNPDYLHASQVTIDINNTTCE